MLLGVLLGRRSYPLKKYFFVLLIVAGIALFMFKDKVSKASGNSAFGLGEILLLLSLTMDGLNGAIQVIVWNLTIRHSNPFIMILNSFNRNTFPS